MYGLEIGVVLPSLLLPRQAAGYIK